MEHCIALPEATEDSEDLDPEISRHPDFDLIVFEVHLKDVRAEEEEKQRKLEEEAGIAPASTPGLWGSGEHTTYIHTYKHTSIQTYILLLYAYRLIT